MQIYHLRSYIFMVVIVNCDVVISIVLLLSSAASCLSHHHHHHHHQSSSSPSSSSSSSSSALHGGLGPHSCGCVVHCMRGWGQIVRLMMCVVFGNQLVSVITDACKRHRLTPGPPTLTSTRPLISFRAYTQL